MIEPRLLRTRFFLPFGPREPCGEEALDLATVGRSN